MAAAPSRGRHSSLTLSLPTTTARTGPPPTYPPIVKLSFNRHLFRQLCLWACAAVLAAAPVSCNGLIYDDEGDCAPVYKVRFVYDMNMKFADAFPHEVKDVTLYVINERTGQVVLQKHETGEALSQPGYTMDVEVEPGDYTLLAWCGEGHRSSFGVAEASQKTGLSCTLLDRSAPQPGPWGTDGDHVRHRLGNLYHGRLEGQNFTSRQGTHTYTVPLTKNTNDIHIVLQHLSGEPVDKDAFTFAITDENGLMGWDNALLPEKPLTYYAWHKAAGTAGLDVPDYTAGGGTQGGRAIVEVSAAVAELSVARLMESHRHSAFVDIYNDRGERIVHLPYIDYFLLVKGKQHEDMSDQEYLDRQDDYSMVFFLDKDNQWINSHIFINSWKIVLQDTEL